MYLHQKTIGSCLQLCSVCLLKCRGPVRGLILKELQNDLNRRTLLLREFEVVLCEEHLAIGGLGRRIYLESLNGSVI